jgi:ATP-dependent 26S proteasome regulatory subunit
VVFMEDVEQVAAAENSDQISELLDLFDGIQAKNTELMVVLTTNHPDKLHKGMMRPGRLDAIIEIANLDAVGIEKLIRAVIGDRLAPNVEFGPVCEAAEGYLPAFVKELADRAVRYALSRSDGDIGDQTITTEDLVHAAAGLRPQFQRMQDAPEFSEGDTLAESLRKIGRSGTEEAIAGLTPNAGDESIFDQVWDPEAIARAQQNGR